jgi:hypothetical protein
VRVGVWVLKLEVTRVQIAYDLVPLYTHESLLLQ